ALLLDSPAFLLAGASLAVLPLAAGFAFHTKTQAILASVSVERTPSTRVARQGVEFTVGVSVAVKIPLDTRVRIRDLPPTDRVRAGEIPEFTFSPGEPPTAAYPLVPLLHGTLSIQGIHIEISDRFFRTETDMTGPAYAGPEIEVLPVPCFELPGAYPASSGRLERDRFTIFKGATIRSFRQYVPGDDIRFVDWKLSAKSGKFIVREYTSQEKMPGLIVLDLPDQAEGYDTDAFSRLINRVTGEAEQAIRTAGEVSILLISGINLAGMLLNERRLSACITWIRQEAYPRNRLYHAYRLGTTGDIRTARRSIQRRRDRADEQQGMEAFLTTYDDVLSKDLAHREKYVFDVQISRLLQKAGPFDEVRVFSLLSGDISHIRHVLFTAKNAHIESRLLSPAAGDKAARRRLARTTGTVHIEAIS
ncbi:MAG: DUF58 domain-containing protein, partial [Methanoregula sp.]|nr:DUF58 domain-containing protein [Methanoregula sp.]